MLGIFLTVIDGMRYEVRDCRFLELLLLPVSGKRIVADNDVTTLRHVLQIGAV